MSLGETGCDAVFNNGDACIAMWSDGISYEGTVVFQSDEKEKCHKFRLEKQKQIKKPKAKRKSIKSSNNEVMDPLSKKKKEANLEKKTTERIRQETTAQNAKEIFQNCMLGNASVGTCISTNNNNCMLDSNQHINNVSDTATVPYPPAQIHMHVPSPVPNTNFLSLTPMPRPAITSQPPHYITTIPLAPVNNHVPSPAPVSSTNVHSLTPMPRPAITSQPPHSITTIPLAPVNNHVPSPAPVPSTNVHSLIPMPRPAITSQPPHNITNFNPGLVNTHVPSSAPFPHIQATSQQPTYTPLVNAHVPCSVPLPYTAEPLHHYPNQHDKQVSASNSYVPSNMAGSSVLQPLTSGSHSFVLPLHMSTNSQQSSYMHVDTATSRPLILSNNDIPASNNSTSTSTNPLSNFTELTDLPSIDSLQSNNNCADCIMKDQQSSSIQQYIEKLKSDWREEATRLKSEIESRTDDTVIQNDDLGKLAIFNSTAHYMPSRGTEINKCLYKISDVPDTNIRQGYMRLVEGHQLLVPVPWMNDIQGAYKGKTKTCAIKLMFNVFFSAKRGAKKNGSDLADTHIGKALKAFAMKTWGLDSKQ